MPSVPGLYMHVTVIGVEGCQMCLSLTYTYLCRRVPNVPGLYMHVTVIGVECAKCAWVVHACYCTWCRRVPNVP